MRVEVDAQQVENSVAIFPVAEPAHYDLPGVRIAEGTVQYRADAFDEQGFVTCWDRGFVAGGHIARTNLVDDIHPCRAVSDNADGEIIVL